MAYTRVWLLTDPSDNDPAMTLADIIRDLKDDIEERINTILGKPINTPFADPIIDYYDAGNSGVAKQIDWANGPIQKLTLTGNCTITSVNQVNGRPHVLIMVQDGTGGRTVTLTGWDFGSGAYTPDTAAARINAITGIYDGTQFLAATFIVGAT